jgi:integrase
MHQMQGGCAAQIAHTVGVDSQRNMSGRQAKILLDRHTKDFLAFASLTRNPLRNRVIVLLSVKAGIRAGEIAKLTWDMVLDADAAVGSIIELRDEASKKAAGD